MRYEHISHLCRLHLLPLVIVRPSLVLIPQNVFYQERILGELGYVYYVHSTAH
jgi:hypothetical protein